MDRTRRGFLRLLGVGAAAPIAAVLPSVADANVGVLHIGPNSGIVFADGFEVWQSEPSAESRNAVLAELRSLGPNPGLIGRGE